MELAEDTAAYRVRRFYKKGETPKKYRNSFEVTDEHSGQVMAVCDLIGQAVFTPQTVTDHEDREWRMAPNRRIMPSRWSVTDPDQRVVMQFDQRILGKVVNPLGRTALTLLDGEGWQIFRLADARSGVADWVLGLGPDDWAIYSGDMPVAKLGHLERPTEPAKGIFGWLKKKMALSDRAVISAGSAHVLPAPVALAMLLIFDEVTDTSGG